MQFYFEDREGGVRFLLNEEAEALDYAAEALAEYRRAARLDGEWSSGVEGVEIGLAVDPDDEEQDIALYKLKAIGNDDIGYDYAIGRLDAAPFPEEVQNLMGHSEVMAI